ncbi:hypothetical protein YTPLAS21_19280 [Candidatus Nitrosocosmicus sp.]|nr:hypothetical protein YTPLAS21_19280 [Candidatus Nitrosocosmicus sp.]
MEKEIFTLDSYRMLNQFKAFFEYCEKNGIELTQDDKIYIKQSVLRVTRDISVARAILHRYYLIYKDTMENEPDVIRKQNMGRRKANRYLYTQSHNMLD